MKNKFGILFDCDGTLLDSLGVATESFNVAMKALGLPEKTEPEIKKYFGQGADRILNNLIPDKITAEKAFQGYITDQKKKALKNKIYQGIPELLIHIKQLSVFTGIVTGRHSLDLKNVLEPHNISHHFDVLISDDLLKTSKPSPEGILKAISEGNLDPKNVMYIGDSAMDIIAAKKAGCVSVAALWDRFANAEALKQEEPHFLADHPNQLRQFIDNFIQTKN